MFHRVKPEKRRARLHCLHPIPDPCDFEKGMTRQNSYFSHAS